MSADKDNESDHEHLLEMDELLERIRERHKEIQQREGLLTDSTALIREDRDR